MKYGKVAIVGRPNTGKSTLINAIMNQKVSITSPLPQTTRRAQTVLFSDERGKILFTDTPGLIGKVVDLMSKRVNEEIPRELAKTDLVVAVVDISRPKNEEENKVLGLLRKIKTKKILDLANQQADMTSRIWYRDSYTRRYSKFLNECLKVGLTDIVKEARILEQAIKVNG